MLEYKGYHHTSVEKSIERAAVCLSFHSAEAVLGMLVEDGLPAADAFLVVQAAVILEKELRLDALFKLRLWID